MLYGASNPGQYSFISRSLKTLMSSMAFLQFQQSGSNAFISAQNLPTGVNTFDGITVKDVTPTPTIENGGSFYPVFSASEENTYFMGNWWNGIHKVTGGKVVNNYNWENSPMEHALGGYYCSPIIALDKAGNLWAAQSPLQESSGMMAQILWQLLQVKLLPMIVIMFLMIY